MIDDPELGASKLAEKNAMSLRTLNRKLMPRSVDGRRPIRQYRLQKKPDPLKKAAMYPRPPIWSVLKHRLISASVSRTSTVFRQDYFATAR